MRNLFFIAILLGFSFPSFSQTLPEKIVASLDSFSLLRPQEKTYLQTDRSNYLAGETIQFKAYNVLYEKASILSKVVYVDMADASGKVLQKNMLKLNNGSANGSIDIGVNIPSGKYYLRCYTLWMLNFPSFITQKEISVANKGKLENEKNKIKVGHIQLSFFPEGGDLINNLKSVVAFKASDENSNPIAVSGDIINSRNEKITSFETLHDGMGVFEITPDINETYKAIIYKVQGTNNTFKLPLIKEEGVVITVDNSGNNKIFFKAARSEKNKSLYNNLLVTAQLNYEVVYMGKLNMDEGLDALAINKKNISSGIMQITLLTENGKPLAERLVFIANHSIKNDLIEPTLIDNQKRKKNIITINTSGFSNLDAAISITNTESETIKNKPTIVSSLLLTSDIKGTVSNAGYYFKDKDSITLSHLNLIMLTNGWRRFKLDEIITGKLPELHYPFERGLSITGKVLQANGKSILKTGKMSLIIESDSTTILSEAKVNDASVFVVDNIDFKKEASIYYQGVNEKKEKALVSASINPAYFDTLKTAAAVYSENYTISDSVNTLFKQIVSSRFEADSTSGKILSGVFIKGKKRNSTDSLNNVYASTFFSESDQTLVIEDPHYIDIWQFLELTVPGILINKTDTETHVNFSRYVGLDVFSTDGENVEVKFFLDEMPISKDMIDAISPSEVGLVKVYKGTSGIALGAARGAIALYTKKGGSKKDMRKGFEVFKKSGYSVSREFYHIDYSKIKPDSIASDVRPTLYWNPQVKIKDNKALIEFYNDDSSQKFNVVIEGMDENGKVLHAEKIIE
jgi:hypothetical protein